MFRIGKSFTFDAAHQLRSLPEGHKCGRLRGHTYTITVVPGRDDLVEPGFVTDFGSLLRSSGSWTSISITGSQ